MSGVAHKKVDEAEDGMRLDRWFRLHFPDLRHGQLQKLLRTGQVRVDGGRVKSNTRMEMGQEVRVPPGANVEPGGEGSVQPPRQQAARHGLSDEDREFVQGLVIHKDDDVIAINKPSGLPVQGGTRSERHLDLLLDGLKFKHPERPRLVHRLDKDTSGVLLLARSRQAAAKLGQSLKHRDAKKLYWALAIGVPRPSAGRIDLALVKRGRAGQERVRGAKADEEGGQRAVTYYRVLDQAGNRLAWLGLMPITGRTHQIRAHCAAIGHPIAGDGKYGGFDAHPGGEIARRLHLHARAIKIPHPSGGWLEVDAPMPEHMVASWKILGFEADRSVDLAEWDV